MSEEEEMSLAECPSPSFDHEDHGYFSSFYASLDDVGRHTLGTPTTPSRLGPDLDIVLGTGETLKAHFCVMAHFCLKLLHDDVKKGKEGRTILLVHVPDKVRATPEGIRIFRKALYLKELAPTSFDLWLQVRRLAVHYGCRMVLQKCDEVIISLDNCHTVFDKWPHESKVKERALEFVKGNLKTLVDTGRSNDFGEELWVTILSLNDVSHPLPSEKELFQAVLNWQDKHRAEVDAVKLRSLFRDLFRFPLMSTGFLWSKRVRECGVLDLSEIEMICDEITGEGRETHFNKTPRGVNLEPDQEFLVPQVTLEESHGYDTVGARTQWSINNISGPSCEADNVQEQMLTISRIVSVAEPMGPMGMIPLSSLLTTADKSPSPHKKRKKDPGLGGRGPGRPRKTHKTIKSKTRHPPTSSSSVQLIEEAMAAAESSRSTQQQQLEGSRTDEMKAGWKCTSSSFGATPQDLAHTAIPPSATLSPHPEVHHPSRRSRARNIEELQTILARAIPWEEIELVEDVFEGPLRFESLPEGVRIFGGPLTRIRATWAEDYIWSLSGMTDCTIDNLSFIKEGAHREKEWTGLRITGVGVKVHDVAFEGCHLELAACDRAEVSNLTVDSSAIGIFLDHQTKNTVVTNSCFSNSKDGIRVYGCNNRITNVMCDRVQVGVIFYGIHKDLTPCSGNSLNNLIYKFSRKQDSNNKEMAEQTAVKIRNAQHNLVTNVKCEDYILNAKAGSSLDPDLYALWITAQDKDGSSVSSHNTVDGVSGGPVWVEGKNNSLRDVTDCASLQTRGSRHHFMNCTADKIKKNASSQYTNCRLTSYPRNQ